MLTDIDALKVEFFNKSSVRFTLLDKDFNIIDVNDAVIAEYHLNKADFIGKNILDLSPDIKEKRLFEKYQNVIKTGESIIIEDFTSHPKFGNKNLKIKAFKVGEGLGITSSNITEYKRTIEALEVFSYKSSHDMRGPINNILGISEVALSSVEDESAKEYFSIIQNQAKNLSKFLSELLETIKTQNHDVKISLIDFKKSLDDVKKSLSFTEGYADINFVENIEEVTNFSFDQSLVTSVFQNLIENAIKYRNNSNQIHQIKINLALKNNIVEIIISDNGIGISEQAQESIFKMFFRATNQSTGSGLGLYNLRYAIEKLGGHIKFESQENAGTTFMVYLPNKG